MKTLLLMLVAMLLLASCTNELVVKLDTGGNKVIVRDYNELYDVTDSVYVYYETYTGDYTISNSPFASDDGAYSTYKGVVTEIR